MAYWDFKDLNKRRAVDNVLRNKAFNNAKNPKHVFLIKNQRKNNTNQLLENFQ